MSPVFFATVLTVAAIFIWLFFIRGKRQKQQLPPFYNLDIEDWLQALEQRPNAILLDIRGNAALGRDSIPNAVLVNFEQRPAFVEFLHGLDLDQPYFVYCEQGQWAAKACEVMYNNGFKQLYALRGGFAAWQVAQGKDWTI